MAYKPVSSRPRVTKNEMEVVMGAKSEWDIGGRLLYDSHFW